MSRLCNQRILKISEQFSIPVREVRDMKLAELECSDLAMRVLANEYQRLAAGGIKKRPKSQAALGMKSRVPGQRREFGS